RVEHELRVLLLRERLEDRLDRLLVALLLLALEVGLVVGERLERTRRGRGLCGSGRGVAGRRGADPAAEDDGDPRRRGDSPNPSRKRHRSPHGRARWAHAPDGTRWGTPCRPRRFARPVHPTSEWPPPEPSRSPRVRT